MDLATFFESVLKETGPTSVAIMALYFMNLNHAAYMVRERENAEVHRIDKTKMLEVLERYVVTNAELSAAISTLGQSCVLSQARFQSTRNHEKDGAGD